MGLIEHAKLELQIAGLFDWEFLEKNHRDKPVEI
jgi:hypothetical protein